MKKTYLLLLIIFLVSCSQVEYQEPTQAKEDKIEQLGYDYEKNVWINSILDSKPLFIEKRYNTTILRYSEVEIRVTHYEAVPYKCPESWDYSCNDKYGNMIMIQSNMNISKHNVSKSTLNRIKTIAGL